MDAGLLILPWMVSFIMYKCISAGLHLIDSNVRYNNAQSGFIPPPRWAKKIFKLKSDLLPKYICYRFYSIFLVLLAPICVGVYIATYNSWFVFLLINIQVVYIILDMLCGHVFFKIYDKKRKNNSSGKGK